VWLRLRGRRSRGASADIGRPAAIGETYDKDRDAYRSGATPSTGPAAIDHHSTPPFYVLAPESWEHLGGEAAADALADPAAPDALRIEERADEHTQRLTLIGQLDLNSAPMLQAEISRCHASGFKSIQLDLSRLEFIDSTGLWVITTARRWCDTHGCGFTLIPGSEPVQSVFELTGLSDVLPFVTE
jgi:anti-sigma B factor antagonist